MERNAPPKNSKTSGQTREDRLKAALKANMGRRKAQARARATSESSRDSENNKG
ncbi:hypothetical protein [Shimia sp. SDUM112013]|uniref:hypothetical protein n=1 Tax=Shimia sp. SDUM112013 TaxID=3136160 RepID=UPI0032EE5798